MLATIKAAILAFGKILGIVENEQERRKREELRKAGRDDQQVADLKEDRKQSARARKNAADVDSMSGDAVTDELRRYARKPKRK